MNRHVVRSSHWSGRIVWLALVLILVIVTAGSGSAQGQGQGRGRALFERGADRIEADSAGVSSPSERGKKRGRRVRANVAAVTAGDTAGGDDVLTLNLFDDVEVRARRRGNVEHPRPGGAVWRGQLLDIPGEATIAVNGDVMAGTVFADDRVFEIIYAGNGEHEIREIDQSQFPTDDPPFEGDLAFDAPADAGVEDAAMAGDSANQVDVMVVWTPAARTAAGGTAAMQSLVDLSVANANTSYANSSVTQRLRLVYAGEISYTETTSDIAVDLSRLQLTTDGHLDTVHTLRNTYGADVVTLLGAGYGSCGIGYLMNYVSSGFASMAFNIVDRTCAAGNLSFAHELGHNMGLHHDPANASGAGAYSYAYGYQEPSGAFRTVMAYPCPTGSCPRLMRFSNPSLTYNGMPTGTANHNNATALNNTASAVANFRQAVGGGSCSYSLGASSTSVASSGASSSVSVIAGSGCSWTASSNVGWVSIISGASGTSNGTVGFSVQANTAGTTRAGTLTIAGQAFTVSQAAAACGAFSLSPASQSVSAAGGSLTVTVSGTTGCSRTATSNAAWITVSSGASGTGAGTVALSVATNTVASSRTGTVTIGGQTFTVTQSAATCGAFSLSPASQSVSSAGGSVTVTVSGTTGCSRTATSNAGWITVTSGASGTGAGSVTLSVAANTAGASRSGTVTIGGQTFSVTQSAAACGAFSLSPTSTSVSASGGAVSVSVTGTASCARSATSNSSWITVTSGASGTGSGTVTLSVAANTAGTSRTGSVTVAGQVFSVTQSAAACGAFTLSPSSQSAIAAGGTVSTIVTGTVGCSRTATSNASWITVTAGASGSGTGTVSTSVAANTAGSPRTGTVTIGGQTFTINQAAASCSFTVSPTSKSMASSGGSFTVNVTTLTGCAWSASSASAWLTTSGAASGTGSGSVTLVAAGNASSSARAGSATVAGRAISVSQSGAAPVAVTGLTSSVALPATAGASITWTAAATGGSSPLVYQFWRYRQSTNAWTMVRDYSSSPSYTWATQSSDAGTHALQVWVKQTNSPAQYDAYRASGTFALTAGAGAAPPPPTGPLTAAGSSPTPRVAGSPLTWTITTSGGVAPVAIKFWVYSQTTNVWTMVRDYASGNVLTYTPPSAGRYALQAWVRNAGSSAQYDIYVSSGYFDVSPAPAGETSSATSGAAPASVLLTTDRPAPFVGGVPVVLTATPIGTSAATEHKFWEYADGVWRVLREYAPGTTVTWQPTAGTRALQVWTRRVGSPANYEVYAASGYMTIGSGN